MISLQTMRLVGNVLSRCQNVFNKYLDITSNSLFKVLSVLTFDKKRIEAMMYFTICGTVGCPGWQIMKCLVPISSQHVHAHFIQVTVYSKT